MAEILNVTIEVEKLAKEICDAPLFDGKSLKQMVDEVKRFQWIPADKAKPWFNYDVLVCCADGQIRIGYYEQEGNIWYAGNRPSEVIAWMQLPDVYEGDKDDSN